MKTHIILMVKVLFLAIVMGACDTDEEVYQVTDRTDAYISSVQLYTADNRNVATQVTIDDVNGIINVEWSEFSPSKTSLFFGSRGNYHS